MFRFTGGELDLYKNIVKFQNIMISIVDTWSRHLNPDFTLGDSLFGAVKLTKNADPVKYGYSCYGIGFDAGLQISGFQIIKC